MLIMSFQVCLFFLFFSYINYLITLIYLFMFFLANHVSGSLPPPDSMEYYLAKSVDPTQSITVRDENC